MPPQQVTARRRVGERLFDQDFAASHSAVPTGMVGDAVSE